MIKTKKDISVAIGFMVATAFLAMAVTYGCTEQSRAKNFGGNMTETLKPGEKLINVTWKDNQLWLLTRPMQPAEKAETYQFKESSSWGLVQGTVTIKEISK